MPDPSVDPEYATIGGLLLAPAEWAAVSAWLRPEDFRQPLCGEVYQVITDLHVTGKPVDPVTVLAEFRRRGRLRPDGYPGTELIAMVEAVPAPVMTPHYAQLVLEQAVFRAVATCGSRLSAVGRAGRGCGDDALAAAAAVWQQLQDTRQRWQVATGTGAPVSDVVEWGVDRAPVARQQVRDGR